MTLYRRPRTEPKIGELRCKTWRTLPGLDVAPDSPVWATRCKQYWELQARLYGWRMSDFTFAYDNQDGFVSTYCVVLSILPGERTAEHWRVTVESTDIRPLVAQ